MIRVECFTIVRGRFENSRDRKKYEGGKDLSKIKIKIMRVMSGRSQTACRLSRRIQYESLHIWDLPVAGRGVVVVGVITDHAYIQRQRARSGVLPSFCQVLDTL